MKEVIKKKQAIRMRSYCKKKNENKIKSPVKKDLWSNRLSQANGRKRRRTRRRNEICGIYYCSKKGAPSKTTWSSQTCRTNSSSETRTRKKNLLSTYMANNSFFFKSQHSKTIDWRFIFIFFRVASRYSSRIGLVFSLRLESLKQTQKESSGNSYQNKQKWVTLFSFFFFSSIILFFFLQFFISSSFFFPKLQFCFSSFLFLLFVFFSINFLTAFKAPLKIQLRGN